MGYIVNLESTVTYEVGTPKAMKELHYGFLEDGLKRVCNVLGMNPKGLPSKKYIDKLKGKLRKKGLKIEIHYIISDEWYTCKIILKKFKKDVDKCNFMVYNENEIKEKGETANV